MEDDFRDFYAAALPVVYRYLSSRLNHDEQRAMDVTQETFLAIADRWPVPGDVTNRIGWAVGIARHKLVDEFRREQRHSRRLARHAALELRQPIVQTEPAVSGDIRSALAAVPPLQRAALVLRHVDDRPVTEVAALLERSVRATESLLARGRKSLAAAYEAVRGD